MRAGLGALVIGYYEGDRLVFSGKVDVAPLITHRFPLDRVTEAFALASSPTPTSLKVLVTP